MSENSSEIADGNKITFPDQADGGMLEEAIVTVKEAVKKGEPVYIDLAGVNEITAAGVQFCIAVQREMTHQGIACKWLSPSSGFMNGFDTLGFYSEMMKMEFV